MKRTLIIIFLFLSLTITSQQVKDSLFLRKNEISLNFLSTESNQNLIGLSYEYLLNKKHSLGFETAFRFTENIEKRHKKNVFSVFYRNYYSEGLKGFTSEAFLLFAQFDSTDETLTSKNDFFFGTSIGYKFLIEKKITFSTHLGFGVNPIKLFDYNFVSMGRCGISLGYRF